MSAFIKVARRSLAVVLLYTEIVIFTLNRIVLTQSVSARIKSVGVYRQTGKGQHKLWNLHFSGKKWLVTFHDECMPHQNYFPKTSSDKHRFFLFENIPNLSNIFMRFKYKTVGIISVSVFYNWMRRRSKQIFSFVYFCSALFHSIWYTSARRAVIIGMLNNLHGRSDVTK